MKGWNLDGAVLSRPMEDSETGYHVLTATKSRWESNPIPFALDTLPECFEIEPNNDPAHAQKVELPVIINGRIDHPDDWDVFQFSGHAGETIVAEVKARRLNSPLDSVLMLTDAHGKLLAINDDYEDPEAGTDTHYADSYLTIKLPADGTYYLHLGDITRSGGEEYAYRLRISETAAGFRLAGGAVERLSAPRRQRYPERLRLPQRRIRGTDQGVSEGPARGNLGRVRCSSPEASPSRG